MEKKQPITPDITIDEIFSRHPDKAQKLAQEMTSAGLQCASCQAATWETLEVGMLGHGFDEKAIKSLVSRLNEVIEQKSDPETIVFTKRAAERFKSILKQDGKEGWGLRFEDKPGGCGGFEYVLDFSKEPTSEDTVYTSHGVEIHVKTKMLARLLGSEIDYVDGLMGSGFKVANPNVKGSCSCGSSQSY